MMPRAAIPGGRTQAIGKAGGEQLAREVMVTLAGQRLDTIVYVITRLKTSLGLQLPTKAEAVKLMKTMSDDAINEIELNWPDRDRLLAEAIASMMTEAGHG